MRIISALLLTFALTGCTGNRLNTERKTPAIALHALPPQQEGRIVPAKRKALSASINVLFEPKPQPCTKCGAPVILVRIEPANSGFDLRTFECSKCNNVDQYIIEFGTAAPWALHVRA
jgi:hypothetical protein